MRSVRHVWLAACLVAAAALPLPAASGQYLAFIGSYGNTIEVFRFDPGTGKLTAMGTAAETPQPSWLTVHPNGRYLYAINEVPKAEGAVTAFSVDARTGKLALLNKVATKGEGPCHAAVDKTGKMLIVTNYQTGSTTVMPVHADGSLGDPTSFFQHERSNADPDHPRAPLAHSANLSADNRFAIVADKGLDRLLTYRLDPATATIAAGDPPFAALKPGSGPRHFAFSPDARFGYVCNETASTISALSYDGRRGALSEIQTISTLPADYQGRNTVAEIAVGANGRFVYGSNRGHNSIAVFSRDMKKGTLSLVEHVPTGGRTPRSFSIDPGNRYLVVGNQATNNIAVFRIDAKTGRLTPTGDLVSTESPVRIQFIPAQ